MNGDPLNQFQRDIAPYRAVWHSVRVSGLATQENGQWISLGLRVSLSELPPERRPLGAVTPYEWFAYFDGRCQIEQLDGIAEKLARYGYLTVPPGSPAEFLGMRVFLNRQAALRSTVPSEEASHQTRTPTVPSGPTWSYWGFQNRGNFPHYGTDRASYVVSASGERNIDILSYQDKQRVDSKLRAGDPVFDGFEGLIEQLLPGLNSEIHQTDAQFQLVAPLPFFLDFVESTKLMVRAPVTTPHGGLGVRFFFHPKGLSASPLLGLPHQNAVPLEDGTAEWHFDIPWPEGSTMARACLFFLDRQIDSLKMNRWPAGPSLRVALDDYFDSKRSRLVEGLGFEGGQRARKPDSKRFEAAVARLIGLLGVPLVWYGASLAEEARPDLGGLVPGGGKSVAVLAECTLSKPEEKFSELHKRADEASAKLGTEAEVLAVVFTSAPTTQTEAKRAAEHGIALVGPDELRELLGFLKCPEDPVGVLAWLRQLRSIATEPFDWHP